jgi:hypothetical protein
MIPLRRIACGVIAHGAWVSPTPADVSTSSAQAAVPIEQEPMHALKFESDYVRVFDVLIPPGSAT